MTVYREAGSNAVGLFLSSNLGSPGERASLMLADQACDIAAELSGATVDLSLPRPDISQQYVVGALIGPSERQRAMA
ncbi:hypothetical protein ACCT32_36655, partial [Rhizobium brockwellii]